VIRTPVRALLAVALVALPAHAAVVPGPWAPVGGQAGAAFGTSVAPAGDVNGDGYNDVLVGAPLYDNGQADEGRAFLYLGSANGLAASPAWTWEPDQAGANAGAVVAPAGDVNQDGYADFLVGAPQWDEPGHVDAGAVFVFYGSSTGPPLVPSLKLVNQVTDSRFGSSACTAGDVNADQYADVVVGAPRFANGQANEGAVYVFHGSLIGLSGTAAFTLEGNEVDARAGASVSTAGDVNADSYSDIIYGAPGSSPSATPAAGKAVVLRGSGTGITGTLFITITGSVDSMATGAVVALAGDMNGDGYADILVGSPGTNVGGPRRGSLVVYPGTSGGVSGVAYLTLLGTADQEHFGSSLASAGDVDGDGYADLAFGRVRYPSTAGATGQLLLYAGGRTAAAVLASFNGATLGARFGAAVATAGDFDGNGFAEVLVGSPDFGTVGLEFEGAVSSYVGSASRPSAALNSPLIGGSMGSHFGGAVAILPRAENDQFPGYLVTESTFDSPLPNSGQAFLYHPALGALKTTPARTYSAPPGAFLFGITAADAGSVERDEWSDFILGAPAFGGLGSSLRGHVFLYRGDVAGPVLDAWDAHSDSLTDNFGNAIAARGDVNGDGYTDVLVGGNRWSDPTLAGCGKVWLYPGGPSGLGAATWTAQGSAVGEYFGSAVAFADLDADGYSDAVISSLPGGSPGAGPARVQVFFGGPAGLSAQPAYSISPSPQEDSFGFTIAGLGDVDGDGVCDLAVAAPDAHTYAGEVFVYRGSKARANPVAPLYTLAGAAGGAGSFGSAIGGGGDLNGDGLADFVIGEPYYANGQVGEGRLLVYLGRPTPGAMLPDTTYESNVANVQLGISISPLADLNGDGFADILAGSNVVFDLGRAYVWFGGGEGTIHEFLTTESGFAGLIRFSPAKLDNAFLVGSSQYLRSAAGRDRVGQDLEIRLQDEPFTGIANRTTGGSYFDTGAPSALGSVTLASFSQNAPFSGTTYHWRARAITRSPYFPRSRWIAPEGRLSGDYDFRTGGAEVAVGGDAPRGLLRLGRVEPNPSASSATISFNLPARAAVRLDVYDLAGRHVRSVVHEELNAGAGARTWDGTDDAGRRVRAGIYFIQLRAAGAVDRSRIVRLD